MEVVTQCLAGAAHPCPGHFDSHEQKFHSQSAPMAGPPLQLNHPHVRRQWRDS